MPGYQFSGLTRRRGSPIPGVDIRLIVREDSRKFPGMHTRNLFRVWTLLVLCHAPWAMVKAQNPGSLDPGFDVGAGLSKSSVSKAALQSDGKTVLLGDLEPWPRIARVNRDGTLDRTFAINTGFSAQSGNEPVALAIQGNDKILVGGFFASYQGVTRRGLLRLNADGSFDAAFDPGAALGNGAFSYLIVRHLFAQADGKFVAAGVFTYTSGGVQRKDIVRFNSDGSVDQSFTPDPAMPRISAIDVSPAGQIVLSYQQEAGEGVFQGKVVRLLPSGQPDPSFNTASGFTQLTSAQEPETLKIEADGSVLAAGLFDMFNNVAAPGFIRLTPSGSLDSNFVSNGLRDIGSQGQFNFNRNARILSIESAAGFIYVGGSFNRVGTGAGPVREGFARLLGNGALDTSYLYRTTGSKDASPSSISSILLRPGLGQVVIAGRFGNSNDTVVPGIAQLSSSGIVDTVFNTNLQQGIGGFPNTITLLDDGKMLVSGFFDTVNGLPQPSFVRLQKDGALDPGFSIGTGFISNRGNGADFANAPQAVAIQQDGRMLVAVPYAEKIQGLQRNSVVRLNADGSVDPSFDVDTGLFYEFVRGQALGLALWNDKSPSAVPALQKVIVVGSFTHIVQCGVTHAHEGILRLNEDGMLDPTFNPGTGFTNPERRHALMKHVAVQPDGKILVGGDPLAYNGTPVPHLVRLNGDATLDPTFDAAGSIGNSTAINAMDLLPNGQIMIAGHFSINETASRTQVIRLNANGSRDASFEPGTGFGGSPGTVLHDMAVQPDGKVLVGGLFQNYRGVARNGIARLNTDGSLDTSYNAGAGVVRDPDGAFIFRLAPQADGRTMVGGSFYRVDGTVRPWLARLQGNPAPTVPGTLHFASGSTTVKEKDGTIRFAVRRTGGAAGAVSVNFTTTSGTAMSGADFTTQNGVLTWGAGESLTKFIDVPVAADSTAEGSEFFNVALSNATGGATLGLAASVANLIDAPFDAWRWEHFGAEANNPDRGAALGDFDRDGIPNLVEYGLGLSPTLSSPDAIHFAVVTNGQPTFSFTRRLPAKNELTYTVQTSPDLAVWTDGSSYSPAGNVPTTLATSDITPQGSPPGFTVVRNNNFFSSRLHYMRLKISRP